jgi:hypothetical protein
MNTKINGKINCLLSDGHGGSESSDERLVFFSPAQRRSPTDPTIRDRPHSKTFCRTGQPEAVPRT